MTFEDFDQTPVDQILIMMGIHSRELNSRFADILCPYHADTKPSATVYRESKMFTCFACGETRHISRFYQDVTGEELFHGKPSLFIKHRVRPTPPPAPEIQILGALDSVYDSPEAMAYIEKRKIPKSFLDDFSVQTSTWLRVNDTFMGQRLIIPIVEGGRVVSYEGRTYVTGATPKVLYPKGAPQTLFNFDNLDRSRPVIAVEGLLDFAVLWGYGYRNLTTIMGASISSHQQSLLNQIPEIILIMDPDAAGEKVIETFEKFYPGKLRVCQLEGKDPKEGTYMEIEKAVKGAVEPSGWYMKKFDLFPKQTPSLF